MRLRRHGSGIRWEEETPARNETEVRRHRRTIDHVIPWLGARQQSQPPFHLAEWGYRQRPKQARSVNGCWSGGLAKV